MVRQGERGTGRAIWLVTHGGAGPPECEVGAEDLDAMDPSAARRLMRRPATAAMFLLVALMAGCSSGLASPTVPVQELSTLELATPTLSVPSPTIPGKEPYTQEPPTPTLSVLATVAPSGHGRPYTAADMAALLGAAAARPSGFAGELNTPPLVETMAGVLAGDVYTYDGTPYQRVVITARCDTPPSRCDLFLEGVPGFTDDPHDQDGYIWTVYPATARVILTSHGLSGFPTALTASLDALAQSLDIDGQYKDRYLMGVQWELAPPDDAYVLRYSNGLGEGDLVFWVTVDRAARRIVSIREAPG